MRTPISSSSLRGFAASRLSLSLRLPLSSSLAAVLVCVVAACGGSPAPSPEPPAAPPASAVPPASSATSLPSSRRSPADDMLRYWTFDEHTQLVLYADVGGLLHTELGSAVVPAVLTLAGAGLSRDQAQCIRGATDSVKDLVLGADDDAGLVVVRFDESAFQPGPCLAAAKATPKTIEGAREAFAMNDSVVAHVPGMLLVGPEPYVVRALKPRTGPASWPSSVSLGPDEYAAWHLHAGAGIEGKGSLLASSTRFRLAMEGDLPEVLAQNVEQEWQARKSEAAKAPLPAEQAALLQKLVQSIDVK
ncbi:MAG TPA: hypothetical protein VIY73_04115, partial [Polyangiaceae bacterium]